MQAATESPDLNPNEVAVLAGVSPRAVRKAMGDKILIGGASRPLAFRRAMRNALGPSAVTYMTIMSAIDWPIPTEGRLRIARFLREASPGDLKGHMKMTGPLTLDIGGFAAKIKRVAKRTGDYRRARDTWIHSDSTVMGGTPVIRGTRMTVYAVLGRVEAGDSLDSIADEDPDVPRAALDVAVIFAKANPMRGRPSGRPWAKTA